MADALSAWRDAPAKSAIVDFVGRVTRPGSDFVPPAERVAVFDNDGTLWCEKPAYVQLDFIVRSLVQAAQEDPKLLDQALFRAAHDGDLAWFGRVVEKHYQGDDSMLREFAGAALHIAGAESTEDYAARVARFFDSARHPSLDRPYPDCGYAPMVQLLRYLEGEGFTCYIVSGGGRDFMRVVSERMYAIPPERVVGSSLGLTYDSGRVRTTTELDIFDDGPAKPARVWSRIGRRPILAAGNSNGDIEMLEYATSGPGPGLALLVEHDDADREFAYTAGAERAEQRAAADGWVVVSMARDWAEVFDD
ncbi:HAD family hydrolase [Nocardia stercoris]|uniref:Haloacid dehalogenase-like hydrolase n=1 Tax=Nocardia stercoris TaxID=2483361 RepID=A0A3M2LGV3_9NOCA|nr:HAD family hydrolase [Nocardia stercoris]RMI33988.1 haloacid dehalogenase-like hydrolase [Nocardia stercoris]